MKLLFNKIAVPLIRHAIQPIPHRASYTYHMANKSCISHKEIEFRAFTLWLEDKSKNQELSADHYWQIALKQLIPVIQLAIQAELPDHIICKPGDYRRVCHCGRCFSFHYFLRLSDHSQTGVTVVSTEVMFAKGFLEDSGNYSLSSHHNKAIETFDLNEETQLDRLLVTLETWAAIKRRAERTATLNVFCGV